MKIMDELLLEFIAETREMLAAVQSELVSWEVEPTDKARLDSIFRFVHTVKGNCGFFDLPRLAKLSHFAEGALAEVRAGRRPADVNLVNAVFAVIDRIGAMVNAVEAGNDFPAGGDEELIQALELDTNNTDEPIAVDQDQQVGDNIKIGTNNARSIRLPVNLLDRVMLGASDIVLVRNELARHIRNTDPDPVVSNTFDRLSGIINELREGVSRMRMHRLDHLFTPLPRLVRDLSAELGKKVAIDMEGGRIELDREIIELIRHPLTHILRNAIDHGIEIPSERLAAGKVETGLIQIITRQTGNRISITITDDGKGIESVKLGEKAIAAGIINSEQFSEMHEKERLALIFQPGISTAAQVTSVSGRGVGMDIVRSNIEQLGGKIWVTSEAGEGTRLFLSLPATLSIVPSLTVRIGTHRFGIPRSYIEEIVSSRSGVLKFSQVGDTQILDYRKQHLRCCSLATVLNIKASNDEKNDLLIIKAASGDLFAIVVDEVESHEELVVKPLAPAIMDTRLYTGASLLDDGSLVLMLYVGGIAQQQGLVSDVVNQNRKVAVPQQAQVEQARNVSALLFEGLDGKQRIVRMDAVNRIEKVASKAVRIKDESAQVAVKGEIYPLAGAAYGTIERDQISLLQLSDGGREISYVVNHVLDTVKIDGHVLPDTNNGEIEGVTLIDNEAVEVLDCHWLFANYCPNGPQLAETTCRINMDDPWARSILLPLIETAGYRVIGADTDETADIAISIGNQIEPAMQANETINLLTEPCDLDHDENSIYRYDRSALLALLSIKKRRSA